MDLFGDDTAQDRAAKARRREDGGEIALVLAAFTQRHDVGNNGLDQRHKPATTQALNSARDDQEQHRRRQAAERRAQKEDDDRADQRTSAADDVGQLAVKRRHHGRTQQIAGDDPRQGFDITEVAADRRHGGRDDRLIQCRQQHDDHQAGYDAFDVGGWQGRRGAASHTIVHGSNPSVRGRRATQPIYTEAGDRI